MPPKLEGIVHDLPDAEYHKHPALSSTGARMLLPEYKGSPKKFQYAQTHRRESWAFDVGHAAHTEILGVGSGVVIYPDEHLTPSGNPSTKTATVLWEHEQRANGLTPISATDGRRVNGMAEAVLAHPTARPILENATHREVSVFAEIDGVRVRARFDALGDVPAGVFAVDVKTTDDATSHGFAKSVAKWGYDLQAAWYSTAFEASAGRPVDTFTFVVVEKSAPYEVAVHQLPEIWLQIGRTKAAEARRIYRECVETGVWPGYDESVQFLDPPTWMLYDHENRYDNEEIHI